MANKNVELTFTGSSTDALANTDLQTAPSDGMLLVFVSCDAGTTTTMQLSAPPTDPVASLIVVKNNGTAAPLNELQDTPYMMPIVAGAHARVQLVVGTATLIRLAALFVPK